jgi:predicted dinucleotide-binding enzyme
MPTKKIGVLGTGNVGDTLANGLLKYGYEVMRGSREPQKLDAWKEKAGPRASIGSLAETARFGDTVVLAVKGTAAESVIKACVSHLDGKTVIDACNPIADKPPTDGVLAFFTTHEQSLMERPRRRTSSRRFPASARQ